MKQILSNENTRSQALALTGPLAEIFVSHLQTVGVLFLLCYKVSNLQPQALDKSPNLSPKVREEWIKALQKLAVEAEVLPSQLTMNGLVINAKPLAQGGFSDVYQGIWNDELFAVKRPRNTSQNCSETRKVESIDRTN